MTDQYLPVDTETLDTGDYELWERIQQQEKKHFLQEQQKLFLQEKQQQFQQQQKSPPHPHPAQRQRREMARAAEHVVRDQNYDSLHAACIVQRSGSDDEGDTFYESHQSHQAPLRSHSRPGVRRLLPAPGPADQVMSPYPASEYSDWESEAERDTVTWDSEAEREAVTPTTQKTGASLTMEELEAAATKLNMSLVSVPVTPAQDVTTPPHIANDKQNSFRPVEFPLVPPRQKTELGSDDARGNVDDDVCDEGLLLTTPCTDVTCPDQDVPLVNTDLSPVHDNCDQNDPINIETDENQTINNEPDAYDEPNDTQETDDDTTQSTSDDSECQTVRFIEQKGFVKKSEMRFRDIYDDVVEIQSQEIASGKSADNKDPFETKTSKLEENLKEAIEENTQHDNVNPVTENIDKLVRNEDDGNPFNDAMTESTETIGKPRSTKKTRAPQPPGHGSQSSLISASDNIVHLSPALERRQGIQTEAEQVEGKVLYQSKGFVEDFSSTTKPIRVNIKDGYLEDQILGQEKSIDDNNQVTDPVVVSNTFFKNQDFLQPLIKEREAPQSNRSGHFVQVEESRPSVTDTQPPPIRETFPAMSPTRLFTYNASSGAIGLRRYEVPEFGDLDRPVSPSLRYRDRPSSPVTGERLRPSSPLMSERPGSPGSGYEASSRCPHCTIHTWLPHSPGCVNRRK